MHSGCQQLAKLQMPRPPDRASSTPQAAPALVARAVVLSGLGDRHNAGLDCMLLTRGCCGPPSCGAKPTSIAVARSRVVSILIGARDPGTLAGVVEAK